MNYSFSPPHSRPQEPFPVYGAVLASSPRQGEFGYSDPRRYRSGTGNSGRSFNNAVCCPTPILSQSPTRGCIPFPCQPIPNQTSQRGYIPFCQPEIRPALPQYPSGYIKKDSYWTSLSGTTFAGVRQKVAKTFVDLRSDRKRRTRQGSNMSSSTALLPRDLPRKRGDDHVSQSQSLKGTQRLGFLFSADCQ
jgi:hypothetical protein